MGTDQNCNHYGDRTPSQAYLEKHAPLGGALTPDQSMQYRFLLIAEGIVDVSATKMLEALIEVLRDEEKRQTLPDFQGEPRVAGAPQKHKDAQ